MQPKAISEYWGFRITAEMSSSGGSHQCRDCLRRSQVGNLATSNYSLTRFTRMGFLFI